MNEQDLKELLQNPKLNELKELIASLEKTEIKPRDLTNLINKRENIQNSMTEIEKIKSAWSSMQETINNLNKAIKNIDENQSKIDELKDFHNKALIGNEKEKSIKDDIENTQKDLVELKDACRELCQEYKENFDELYSKYDAKINSLLTGATEASLSVGYKEKREEIIKYKKIWNWIFVLSNIVIIGVFTLYFYYAFNEKFEYIHLLRGMPMFFFSGFFCFYSTRQIEKYSRLEQEYAYKESLSKTYTGYVKQIEDLGDGDNGNLKNKLIEIMLKSAEFNPSGTLEKQYGIKPIDMLKKDNKQN